MDIYVVLKSSTVKVYTGYYRAPSYQMYSKVSAHEICICPQFPDILACKPYCQLFFHTNTNLTQIHRGGNLYTYILLVYLVYEKT